MKKNHPNSPRIGDFTARDEANTLVAFAFRNGPLERLHSGKYSELLESDEYSRITQAEMRELMLNACEKMEELLRLKESNPEKYWVLIRRYNRSYCSQWNR